MKWRAFKYLIAFTFPITVWISFRNADWISFLPLFYAFVIIPFFELLFQPSASNLSQIQEEVAQKDKWYDIILFLTVPVQYFLLFYFVYIVSVHDFSILTLVGRTISMGLMCGVFGINIAHELGHRSSPEEKFLSKALLLTSLYMHFYIEHNRGHHKNVATVEDPATARFNENVYSFWIRCIYNSYFSAWRLERKRLEKNNIAFFSIHNQMLVFQLIQLSFIALIFFNWGIYSLIGFLIASFIGIILLETVNYVEHYGLFRKVSIDGKYERVLNTHSWNSNHLIGRIMLFELSRHSDHHYKASKPYQLLKHWDDSPQMPTGYPGMMLLALIPPLWFRVMNKRLENLNLI